MSTFAATSSTPRKVSPFERIQPDVLADICTNLKVVSWETWRDPFENRPYMDSRHDGAILMLSAENSNQHRAHMLSMNLPWGLRPEGSKLLSARVNGKEVAKSVPVSVQDVITVQKSPAVLTALRDLGFHSGSYVFRLIQNTLSVMDNTLCFSRQVGVLDDQDMAQFQLAMVNAHLVKHGQAPVEALAAPTGEEDGNKPANSSPRMGG